MSLPAGVTFRDLFVQALNTAPFPWQERLAGEHLRRLLIRIPTGAGKTAGIVLAWLWRRRFDPSEEVREETPRRLIYCLPMRVLVEQTYENVVRWLDRLGMLAGQAEWEQHGSNGRLLRYNPMPEQEQLPEGWARQRGVKGAPIAVHLLMGGEELTDWSLWPERDAILIGTQDMLLSRALNRGYAASRYRWPAEYGLVNTDALWVFDEVQLMDAGATTSAQLEGLREQLHPTVSGVHVPAVATSVWMSATLDPNWLGTVNFDVQSQARQFGLQNPDVQTPDLAKRYLAPKFLKKAKSRMGETSECAKEILQAHRPGSLTLAIFNTVGRARDVYSSLRRAIPACGPRLILLHSRFRPEDREKQLRRLLEDPDPEGTIALATQVIEAGVDVSALTLFTEVAPWQSLVQRFGRLNRRGEYDQSYAYWWALPSDDAEASNVAEPYELEDLRQAEKALLNLTSVSPADLDKAQFTMRIEPGHVLRRRDFVDLFDTTPDLAGNDIDVSRFIRSGDERDVQVFWRKVPPNAEPSRDEPSGAPPSRHELCAVPFYEFRDFLSARSSARQVRAWRWDWLDGRWVKAVPDEVYPGQVYLVDSASGGYSVEFGWDPKSKHTVPPVPLGSVVPEVQSQDSAEYDRDEWSESGEWLRIADHTDRVVQTLNSILVHYQFPEDVRKDLLQAARWHDRGKAHPVFQQAIPEEDRPPQWRGRNDLAKVKGRMRPYSRPHFRHELASALALLQAGGSDLAVYLVAAHHGKVRLSIRSLPGEKLPEESARLYARGIWQGDSLPETDLGGNEVAPAVSLKLDVMQLGRSSDGQPSWVERVLKLRDKFGPCRLAFFEALIRAADRRASGGASAPAATVESTGGV